LLPLVPFRHVKERNVAALQQSARTPCFRFLMGRTGSDPLSERDQSPLASGLRRSPPVAPRPGDGTPSATGALESESQPARFGLQPVPGNPNTAGSRPSFLFAP
jgi:hypothetical protein